jgi:myo-inositol 2-dehydrogenase/D-chiro-inositol 1-dehydrogenase
MKQKTTSSNNLAVSRRGFLTNSGISATTAWTIIKPESIRGSSANSAISVGLLGTGGRGSRVAGYAQTNARGRVTALCDLFDDQIEKAKRKIEIPNAATYRDMDKLLSSDIDAVIIATPPFEHPRMLSAAVQANKHIYCEKPMGVDAEGCRLVIEASRRHKPDKCLSTGFQQRYGKGYLEAYRRLQAGDLGQLTTASASWISGDPFRFHSYNDPAEHKLRNWFAYRDYSGDIIVEQDCHNFDVLHWFIGSLPTRVVGYGGTKVRKQMEIMDHLSLSFEFPDGMHVNFEANQITPRGFRRIGERFTGAKGTVETSRSRMIHYRAEGQPEVFLSDNDITIDAVDTFLKRIETGNVENVGERSALSTLMAILGRTAIYENREATWLGEFGGIGA